MGLGSSPLARGTLDILGYLPFQFRFIPTRAGNTSPCMPVRSAEAVHPHSRGEHGSSSLNIRSCSGSSPLARGTRVENTCRCDGGSVHPHSRGEHDEDHAPSHNIGGSSPLARGTHFLDRIDLQGESIAFKTYRPSLALTPIMMASHFHYSHHFGGEI